MRRNKQQQEKKKQQQLVFLTLSLYQTRQDKTTSNLSNTNIIHAEVQNKPDWLQIDGYDWVIIFSHCYSWLALTI